ncbi:MAG: glutamate racemase [Patescibacteria group bacterium]|nr:glutamate racemase [Patescibacteria group bacterium]
MKIGIFDSGLGGLWVLAHLEREMPEHEYVFLADQAHVPYGERTAEEIVNLSFKNTDFLLALGCQMIVVACNTATSAAINKLREKYSDIQFVGMEPAIKPATENSKTGHIGVLATKLTIEGEKIKESINKFANGTEVHTCIGQGLVELVEDGKSDTDEAEELLKKYLEPLLVENIDQLVLGCTHYPFLIKRIQKILGDKVNIIDPAPAVVNRVKFLLEEKGVVLNDGVGNMKLFTTGDENKMQKFTQELFPNINVAHIAI